VQGSVSAAAAAASSSSQQAAAIILLYEYFTYLTIIVSGVRTTCSITGTD